MRAACTPKGMAARKREKDPNVFSAPTVMLAQAFPLWGRRDLRMQAALADVDASRGREHAAQDEFAGPGGR